MKELQAELYIRSARMKKYPLDSAAKLLVFTVAFMLVFVTIGSQLSDQAYAYAFLGYTCWSLLSETISSLYFDIHNRAQSGMLEQIYLMPKKVEFYFFIKNVVSLIFAAIEMVVIGLALTLVTRRPILIPAIAIIPILLVIVTIIGLGYLLIALAIWLKEISGIIQLVQYAYLLLLLAQIDFTMPAFKLLQVILPLEPMLNWLQLLATKANYGFGYYLAISITNSVLRLAIGLVMFKRSNHRVKVAGRVGGN